MNYMENVAKMFGIELGEEFKDEYNNRYKFTKGGVINVYDYGRPSPKLLQKFLTGESKVIKVPWKPKYGKDYYYITKDKWVDSATFMEDETDIFFILSGNYFRTEEEITPEIIDETWERCYGAYFKEGD